MSEYPWNEKNKTFTWFDSLYNPFNQLGSYINIMQFQISPRSESKQTDTWVIKIQVLKKNSQTLLLYQKQKTTS